MIGTGIKPPPLWTSMNAVKSYHERNMTHTEDINNDLRAQIFNYNENTLISNAKRNFENILPDWVKNDPHIVVAGGCFASYLQGENIKDIDVFILGDPVSSATENQMHLTIRNMMINYYPDINNKTHEYVRDNDAVSEVWTETKRKIQFIFTHHATRQDLIKDFDYVHCMTSYHQGKLYITRKIFDAIMKKELIVNNSKNIQEWRRNKFLGRSYKEMEEAKEATLGDILSGALKKVAQTSYVSYEDDDEFSWVR